ncbi:TetR family transcriptional regulator [Streptomyces sp. 150FB]|uniref:TetR/AcrR family transcriptional regulator n=1 Tax=Streptomyces sp. 150FB TaxID=1576605 RepID=UPI0005890058|nr:TetR/AcrR family transcriptional regulator [Streptomyces sp. 150FB]KIF74890.1 TetR family transcriptional regulator [Streptomyces sp. 150FB]
MKSDGETAPAPTPASTPASTPAPAPAPGSVRPGGRTARVREAVLKAAGDTLAEQGFDGLDLAEVARLAGVGKTTVYRRWSTPALLAADLLEDMAEQSLPRAHTGSLEEDLRTNARLVVRTLTDPRQGRLFRALIAAALCDSRAQQALHRFYAIRIDEWAGCVTEAERRGEVPEGTDATAVIAAVSAPLYYAMLNTGAPLDEAHADRAAAAACAAARAGAYAGANAR